MSSAGTASSTSLTRPPPVILALTSAAALYGCYLLYSSYTPTRQVPVRRRGAVHRHRPHHDTAPIDAPATAPGPEDQPDGHLGIDWAGRHVYGYTIFPANGHDIGWHIELRQLPTVLYVANFYRIPLAEAAGIHRDLHSDYVNRWLESNQPFDSRWADEGGGPYTPSIVSQRLQLLGLDPTAVDVAIDEYLGRQSAGAVQDPREAQEESRTADEEAAYTEVEDDTWTMAETQALMDGDVDAPNVEQMRDGQGLKEMLYHIAEQQSRDDNYVHRGITCNSCDTRPIRGIRWHCANCADYDLCADCEMLGVHDKTHVFFKVKIPAPYMYNPRHVLPVIYPGKPTYMDRALPQRLRKKYTEETQYDMQELDALYEQFTCLANHTWRNDPIGIGMAIDWQAYNKGLVPLSAHNAPLPNLLYQRIFAFYDTDKDELVGFEEFLRGCAILQRKEKGQSTRLRKIFDGYDLSGSGYVCREDFLTIFRAYYALQKDVVWDIVAVEESVRESMQGGAEEIVRSAQPLSAAFPDHIVPNAQRRMFNPKRADAFGDRRTDGPTKANGTDEGSAEEIAAGAPGAELSWRVESGSIDMYVAEEEEDDRLPLVCTQADVEASAETTHKRDILYLATIQADNELLDPIFKQKEKIARQVRSTAVERERRREEMKIWKTERDAEKRRALQATQDPLLATAAAQPVQGTMESANGATSSSDAGGSIDRAFLNVEQRVNGASLSDLLRDLGATPMNLMQTEAGAGGHGHASSEQAPSRSPNSGTGMTEAQVEEVQTAAGVATEQASPPSRDTTLPQNRPNTPIGPKLIPASSEAILASVIFGSSSSSMPKRRAGDVKTDQYFELLAFLDDAEEEERVRSGPARISFNEFQSLMDGRSLGFIESWLDLANF